MASGYFLAPQSTALRDLSEIKIGIVGLGYVGLPLAVEFSRFFDVVGYDLKKSRISELNSGFDRTSEVEAQDLKQNLIRFTDSADSLKDRNFFIVTVPTPVDANKKPDLGPLHAASTTIAKYLKPGDMVVYESTVYPGCTEEFCVPILESGSGLRYNQDFFCGYSPERVAPGNKERPLSKIRKIVSGSTEDALILINKIYSKILTAETYVAPSIKVAEAAKVVENVQSDINIAFVNELSLIFNKMDLDTEQVLDAASSKWNFLRFKPGLVGGHCIGVDPYYLISKSEKLGYRPELILAGRKINDSMAPHVARETIKMMIKKSIPVLGSRVLILGMTFKENCPDIRNSKVIDIYSELKDFGCEVDIFDPLAHADDVHEEYGLQLLPSLNLEVSLELDGSTSVGSRSLNKLNSYQAIVIAVAHRPFFELPWDQIDRSSKVIFDVKGILDPDESDARL